MEYRLLGRSGVRVSRLALGTLNFGEDMARDECFGVMNAARAAGINWFDTANSYGHSEEIIGQWLAEEPGRRNALFLSSKVYRPIGGDVNDGGLSARHIIASVDRSLQRLATDHLDMLFLHHVDRSLPMAAVLETADRLMASGKIRYLGTSNFAGWQLVTAAWAAANRNMLGPICEQGVYNLAERMVEQDVLPACDGLGIGFIAYSPLSNGLLSGADTGSTRRGKPRVVARADDQAQRIDAYRRWCGTTGLAMADAALAWLLARPAATAVLIGPRTVVQLEASLLSAARVLSPVGLAELEALWPGPGIAPECFAW